MRMRGLEPPRPYGHTDLNRARLPIPPHPRAVDSSRRDRFGHAAWKPPSLARRHSHHDPPSRTPLSPRTPAFCPSRAAGTAAPAHGETLRRGRRHASHSSPLAGRGTPARAAPPSIDEQARFASRLRESIPEATIRWRYRIVLNGAAVVAPERAIPRLARAPGRRGRRRRRLVHRRPRSPPRGRRAAPSPLADRASQPGRRRSRSGSSTTVSISGIRTSRPAGTRCRQGSPRVRPPTRRRRSSSRGHSRRRRPPGSTPAPRSTRSSPSTGRTSPGSRRATPARSRTGHRISGVAPRAYIGNYKALSVPTDADVGLDGNAAEIVAAIEAAVADGMDVINLSLGEPEVEPSRDLVALALDGAARGRRHPRRRRGKRLRGVRRGIALVARLVGARDHRRRGHDPRRQAEREPRRLQQLGADAALAPAEAGRERARRLDSLLAARRSSSAPGRERRWRARRSPERPHSCASVIRPGRWRSSRLRSSDRATRFGSAASLHHRHGAVAGSSTRARADVPLIARDARLGLLRARSHPARASRPNSTSPTPVGGQGSGTSLSSRSLRSSGAALTIPPTVTVPGTLAVAATVDGEAADGDFSGFIRLTRGPDVRRVPFWLHVSRPGARRGDRCRSAPRTASARGTREASLREWPRYRYPDVPADGAVTASLQGPEQVFRFDLTRPVANFGVVDHASRGRACRSSRGSSRRATRTGSPGTPRCRSTSTPISRSSASPCSSPARSDRSPGSYDIVFDSPTAAGAGSFAFRFWVDDTRPPTAKLVRRRCAAWRAAARPRRRSRDPVSTRQRRLRRSTGSPERPSWKDGTLRIATRRARPRPPQAPPPDLGLPGVAEHGERAADPPEHPGAERDDRDPLATRAGGCGGDATHRPHDRVGIQRGVSRSSVVGSASRSAWTLRTNSSSSLVEITRQLRLALLAVAQPPCIRAGEALEPRPLRGDNHTDADREQHDPGPGHTASVPPGYHLFPCDA